MAKRFDRRVLPDPILHLIREIQGRAECRFGGGSALSGAYLSHRLSGDIDLFVADQDEGLDPGILAWLLGQFPTSPLTVMLEPLSESALRAYRDALRERFRSLAVPVAS